MQDTEMLITSAEPNLDLILKEYQQAGPQCAGGFDANSCENVRRNIWPGQSPDGRKWDEYSADGEPAVPYNGASDTRVPGVDGTINDAVALGMAAYRRGGKRAGPAKPPPGGPGRWTS